MIVSRVLLIFSMIFNFTCHAQRPGTELLVKDAAFNKKLNSLLSFKTPVIGVEELSRNISSYILLDARERTEFDISHLKSAKNIGYDNPDFSVLKNIPKDAKIVVYCSVGYRSEKMGQKLISMGYTNVKNLYGSIFEWTNQGNPIYNKSGIKTNRIHTYNRDWSKWVSNKAIQKVW